MGKTAIWLKFAAVVLLVAALVPVGSFAVDAEEVSCTSQGGSPGTPGTVALVSGTLVITGTDEADEVLVSQSADVVTVTTTFAATETFSLASIGLEIYGCEGEDTVLLDNVLASDMSVWGDRGSDTINAMAPRQSWGDMYLYGGTGNDHLFSGDEIDTGYLFGGPGHDEIVGGDISRGGDGAIAEGGPGNDRITVGDGPPADGNDERWGVRGGPGDDVIRAGDFIYTEGYHLYGDDGHDQIFVGIASPEDVDFVVDGGDGNDIIKVEEIYLPVEVTSLLGGAGRDRITVGDIRNPDAPVNLEGGSGDDFLATGDVFDFNPSEPIVLDGGSGRDECRPGSDLITVLNCEEDEPPLPPPPLCRGKPATHWGTPGADLIRGTNGRDVIVGFGGADTIHGRGGNDLICAGAGNDSVYGAGGADVIYGQTGNDKLIGGPGPDVLLGGGGGDLIRGGNGGDVINGQGGNDHLFGDRHRDVLRGGPGNDALAGGPGRDTCIGGPGRDTIRSC